MRSKEIIFLYSLMLIFSAACGQVKQHQVKVNQLGYLPEMQKIVVVPNTSENHFYLVEQETGEMLFSGKLSKAKKWKPSGEMVRQANFSGLYTFGNFILKVEDPAIEASYPFAISDDVYDQLGEASLHAFYLSRCSMPINEEYAGIYHRPSAFPDTLIQIHASAASEKRKEGSVISSPGGWLDAGDYNKYVVNSGITTYTLLHLYEVFPEIFDQYKLDIPEQDNQLPDLLDEALYNLRWMMTMQDPEDGGVYHKLTSLGFHKFVSPQEAVKQRYVVAKSTAAAYNLAAVCAKAARIFRSFEKELPGFSDTCLVVANRAMNWCERHPEVYFRNPEGVSTGEYDDTCLDDEQYWASVEMALSEHTNLPNMSNDTLIREASWSDAVALAIYSIAAEDRFDEKLKTAFLEKAKLMTKKYKKSAYPVSMKKFVWGSNSVALNQGIFLFTAYQQTGNQEYLDASLANLHYVLGTNATGYSFVTEYGSLFPKNIHDRRSATDNIEGALPGFVVGGPNLIALEDCEPVKRSTDKPALSYIDEQCSYSTNEIAINWQAALVFMLHVAINSGK